jgi:hypothetical protein
MVAICLKKEEERRNEERIEFNIQKSYILFHMLLNHICHNVGRLKC